MRTYEILFEDGGSMYTQLTKDDLKILITKLENDSNDTVTMSVSGEDISIPISDIAGISL